MLQPSILLPFTSALSRRVIPQHTIGKPCSQHLQCFPFLPWLLQLLWSSEVSPSLLSLSYNLNLQLFFAEMLSDHPSYSDTMLPALHLWTPPSPLITFFPLASPAFLSKWQLQKDRGCLLCSLLCPLHLVQCAMPRCLVNICLVSE